MEIINKKKQSITTDISIIDNWKTITESDENLNKIFKDILNNAEEIDYAYINADKEGREELSSLRSNLENATTDKARKELENEIKKFEPSEEIKAHITLRLFMLFCEIYNRNICYFHGKIRVFNGKHYIVLADHEFEAILSIFSYKCGIPRYFAHTKRFKNYLRDEFLKQGTINLQNRKTDGELLNLENYTLHFQNGVLTPKEHNPEDFCTYVLNYRYDPTAQAPRFENLLVESLPEKEARMLLLEFIAYIFCRNLKLEKCMILIGKGATGKSTIFEIITALVGPDNVSFLNLETLCNPNGYGIAHVAGKKLNYSSEISGKNLGSYDLFKQLCSKEPIQAREPFKTWFTVYEIPTLIFNANNMPSNLEATSALYRRLICMPFDQVVPIEKRQPDLAKEIIMSEMSGILNLVIEAMRRLITNQRFTSSPLVSRKMQEIQKETNSVAYFMLENIT